MSLPYGGTAVRSMLDAVSCGSSSATCMAVGRYDDEQVKGAGLVESLAGGDGSSLLVAQGISGTTLPALGALSCPTSTGFF